MLAPLAARPVAGGQLLTPHRLRCPNSIALRWRPGQRTLRGRRTPGAARCAAALRSAAAPAAPEQPVSSCCCSLCFHAGRQEHDDVLTCSNSKCGTAFTWYRLFPGPTNISDHLCQPKLPCNLAITSFRCHYSPNHCPGSANPDLTLMLTPKHAHEHTCGSAACSCVSRRRVTALPVSRYATWVPAAAPRTAAAMQIWRAAGNLLHS